jgi:hypothetical protein
MGQLNPWASEKIKRQFQLFLPQSLSNKNAPSRLLKSIRFLELDVGMKKSPAFIELFVFSLQLLNDHPKLSSEIPIAKLECLEGILCRIDFARAPEKSEFCSMFVSSVVPLYEELLKNNSREDIRSAISKFCGTVFKNSPDSFFRSNCERFTSEILLDGISKDLKRVTQRLDCSLYFLTEKQASIFAFLKQLLFH